MLGQIPGPVVRLVQSIRCCTSAILLVSAPRENIDKGANPGGLGRGLVSLAAIVLVLLLSAVLSAAEPEDDLLPDPLAGELGTDQTGKDILDMDIDQLSRVDVVVPSMDMEVTSVSRQESTVGRSPAAVYVITSEMIRRSGAETIPDLLRFVPGLDVAQVDASSWAVTSRGFNGLFANKLLVLIDGRSIYNSLTGGVYWTGQDVLLPDVERIEVVRGPGGTMWGSNAVNGVINIITKKAQDTQGLLVSPGGGSRLRAQEEIRLGGTNGDGLYWRIWGKHFEHGRGFSPLGAQDDWRLGHGGFRVDWELDPCDRNNLTVQGDYYGGEAGHLEALPVPTAPFTQLVSENAPMSGANVLARFTHVADEQSDWALQVYYDRAYRSESIGQQKLDFFDVDFQHRFPVGRHQLIWGVDYRLTHDNTRNPPFLITFSPPIRTTDLFSAFVQDQITLAEDRLFLTVGSKFENNSYTGFEFQPSGRLLWTPDRQHSAWAAVSRAVRIPSRFDQNGTFKLPNQAPPGSPIGIFPELIGDRNYRSEQLLAYEIGYRAQVSERFAWDLATFLNVYERVQSARTGMPYFDPYGNMIIPLNMTNEIRGQTYGAEVTGSWKVSDHWKLAASYSFLRVVLHSAPGTEALFEQMFEGDSPRNQAHLQSYWDLPNNFELDLRLRYVDNLPVMSVDRYLSLDLRLGWRPTEHFELSVVGQDLLQDHHVEFVNFVGGPYIVASEVPRSVFAKATWRY